MHLPHKDKTNNNVIVHYTFKGSQVSVCNYDKFLSMRNFFTFNSLDPDEMLHCAAFHQGLHCLSKHPFRSFQ